MMCTLLFLVHLQSVLWLASGASISLPNCTDHCGKVDIPYPFGIGSNKFGANCYHDKWFEIICNVSDHPPKPFLRKFNVEVLDINWPGRYSLRNPLSENEDSNNQRLTVGLYPKNFCGSRRASDVSMTPVVNSSDFHGSPFRFSTQTNVFMVEGCGGGVFLKDRRGAVLAGCASVCADDDNDNDNGVSLSINTSTSNCYGVGCCQSSVMSSLEFGFREKGIDFYQIALHHVGLPNSSTCNTSAALIDKDSVINLPKKLSTLQAFPTVLLWSSNSMNTEYYNYDNVSCDYNNAIQCLCKFPYEGNPYLPNGCQVVEECHKCRRHCAIGFNDNNNRYYYYCKKNKLVKLATILGFSIGVGLVLLILSCYWLFKFTKKRKEMKKKAKYFKINGGLLLQQQISSNDGVVEKTKIFTSAELQKATDGFNENRILGQGGQGTVYKGMLADGRIVAIKKSKKVDESQLEQFINEVVILSQINHRNVVKLLGCCLETEVPLLVYEFVPNGTLYEHIRNANEEFHVSWKMRLQIAAESAGALSYLHSSSSAPIYHRDIKSSNILLDEKFRAKISDFGTSRAINIEQTHVTTCVLGTYGYLDPEYFQSNQFTEKSDVYSFGVVLVELITGRKPICPTKDGGWISLAVEFLSYMESCRLSDILDARIVNEGKEEEFMAVANLASQCLDMKGKQRPTMKEVFILLDGIRTPHAPNFKGLIPAENKHVVTEMDNMSNSPFSAEMLSLNDDPAGSLEVQPLMVSL